MLLFDGKEDSLIIKGHLKGQGNQRVSMSFVDDAGQRQSISTTAVQDSFVLKVRKQQQPVIARLNSPLNRGESKTVDGRSFSNPAPAFEFFIYQSDLQLEGDVASLPFSTVKGDRESDELAMYRESVRELELEKAKLLKEIFHWSSDVDAAEKEEVFARSKTLNSKQWELQKKFIEDNPTSFTSLYLLSRMENLYTVDDFESKYQELGDDYKHTSIAQRMEERIAFLSPTAKGKPAIPFTRKDRHGKEIKLSDFKGKLVLLDFWGSWCAPCRASHPHLKQLYTQYRTKGFEIIAIASEVAPTIEEQRRKWLAAIEKDEIDWIHILNNEDKEIQDLVREYRVTSFPTKILLDKDGKILLRITASATDDLDNALKQHLGE
jgi:thiol-disulfide isomerase/thioredoxin